MPSSTKRLVSPQIQEDDLSEEDVPKKENVIFEIQRKKGEAAIAIRKGKLSKRKEWVDFKIQNTWRRYFPNNFIKQTVIDRKGKTSTRYICRFNLYYSEALKAGQDEPEYDQALENQKLNSMADQFKKAVGAVVSLLSMLAQDRSIQLLLVISAIAGIPLGMVLWPGLISTPNTIIHWVPRR